MKRAHKIRLNPTPEQEQYFWAAWGVAKHAFNWGIAEINRRYDLRRAGDERLSLSARKVKNDYRAGKPDFASEVMSCVVDGAFDDVGRAYKMFWDKRKAGTLPKSKRPRRDGRPHGWPRFRNRLSRPNFYLSNTSLRFDGHFVTFDVKRCGPVNLAEVPRFLGGKALAGRVTYEGGHWWLAVQFEIPDSDQPTPSGAVGVDLGVKYLAVTSDGQLFDNPKPYERARRKLRRLQRKLDRQRRANNPGNFDALGRVKPAASREAWVTSNSQRRTEQQIARLHARIKDIRQNAAHELTSDIAKNYNVVGVEDLNIKGMMSNRKLSKAIADAGLYEKRRQLEYKVAGRGGVVVAVDRWFPSSKMCSNCGWVNAALTLAAREWECQSCGQKNERDLNAAVNIRDEALRLLTGK